MPSSPIRSNDSRGWLWAIAAITTGCLVIFMFGIGAALQVTHIGNANRLIEELRQENRQLNERRLQLEERLETLIRSERSELERRRDDLEDRLDKRIRYNERWVLYLAALHDINLQEGREDEPRPDEEEDGQRHQVGPADPAGGDRGRDQ